MPTGTGLQEAASPDNSPWRTGIDCKKSCGNSIVDEFAVLSCVARQALHRSLTRGRMRRVLAALLGMLIGYPVFAFVGYGAMALFLSNHFDPSVEASMTAAFVIGPVGAIIGLIAGSIFGKKRPTPP
jgi:hypothetical protein